MKTKILILITLAIAYFSFIQNRTIRGKVVSDDDGSPIPGVSFTLKNSTTGTVTDG
jgi:TonB-dependent starch-binding outer membrane protein SusC